MAGNNPGLDQTKRNRGVYATRISRRRLKRSPICWNSKTRTLSGFARIETPLALCATLGRDLVAMIETGAELTDLPGIGDDLASLIRELARTGDSALRRRLRSHTAPGLVELLTLPGLRP
jgi:hypothetical protein